MPLPTCIRGGSGCCPRCHSPAPTRSTGAGSRPVPPNSCRNRERGQHDMRALVLREHGVGGLSLERAFPDPAPGDGDVVLRVRAASLNYHDVFTRRGMPGIRIPMPAIMGLDVAGEIAEVGPGVNDWKKGDRV